jgi:hypothetical protein
VHTSRFKRLLQFHDQTQVSSIGLYAELEHPKAAELVDGPEIDKSLPIRIAGHPQKLRS